MTQQGFEDYIKIMYNHKSGTASSYIQAIRIIDDMFMHSDVFALNGKSITCIKDNVLLCQIVDFICEQQSLYKKGEDSFFRSINSTQSSYPRKGFCAAAIRQLLKYQAYDLKEDQAWSIVQETVDAKKISKELVSLFSIDKEGKDIVVESRTRLGQSYFRRMVLANYGNRCCVTGLNVPQTLRASHIVAWAADKRNRMNPENGLCLSATYDAAFDKHLISFDDDYRMIVSKEIRDYYTNDATKDYFGKYEGKQIVLPELHMPSKEFLAKHRELLVG